MHVSKLFKPHTARQNSYIAIRVSPGLHLGPYEFCSKQTCGVTGSLGYSCNLQNARSTPDAIVCNQNHAIFAKSISPELSCPSGAPFTNMV